MSLFGGSREGIRSFWQVESAVADCSVPEGSEGSRCFSDMSLRGEGWTGLEGWCRRVGPLNLARDDGLAVVLYLILGAQMAANLSVMRWSCGNNHNRGME
jgi:hypothetical protein